MTFDDWILALHVLSAATYGASIILFWVLIVAVRTTDTAEGTLRLGPMAWSATSPSASAPRDDHLRDLARALGRGLRPLGRLDHRGDRAVGDRGGPRAATGKEYMRGMTKAQELQAAGQSGSNAELLAINRTQTGVLLHAARLARVRAHRHRHDLEAGRMSILAAVRPDSWNFPLFVHIVGAVMLVGGILTAATFLGFARGDSRLLRLGYWSLLAVALPGWIIMRIGAEWIYSKEGWDDIPRASTSPTGSGSAGSPPTSAG